MLIGVYVNLITLILVGVILTSFIIPGSHPSEESMLELPLTNFFLILQNIFSLLVVIEASKLE